MTLTIEDVIEAHRQLVGAQKVHVSLGPNATPENVASELAALHAKITLFSSFRREELEAQIARLHRVLRDIALHVRRGETKEIIDTTDFVADFDVEKDMRWMFDQRVKRGDEPPEGVAELLQEGDAKRGSRASTN